MLGFKAFEAAQDTLVGIELMHMIKQRQLVVEEKTRASLRPNCFRACLKSGLRGTIVALLEPEMEGTDVTTLPHRSHRCGMDSSRAVHSSGQTRWPPAYDRHARGGECHLLYLAERVSMASAPARLSVSPDGLPLLPDLAPCRGVGAHARHPAWGSPRGLWLHAPAQCRDHRQSDGEDHRKRGLRGYDGGKRIRGASATSSSMSWGCFSSSLSIRLECRTATGPNKS